MPLEPPRDPVEPGSTSRVEPSSAARRDADIVALLAAGEAEAAFQTLASRYAAKVHRLCVAMLGHATSAEDAAQDSLLRAWRSLGSYRAEAGALSTWLYAITRNRCLSLLERAGPPPLPWDDDEVQVQLAEMPAPTMPDASGPAVLVRLVGELPEPQRLALTLYYYEDRAVSEVAAMLGIPEPTAKTHLHRGRDRLRRRLAELGLDDPALWI